MTTWPLRSRLQRTLRRLLVVTLCLMLLTMAWLQLRETSLPGVRVAGEALPPSSDVASVLSKRAADYLDQEVILTAGQYRARTTRRGLGAERSSKELAERIEALGRSGNPFVDLPALVRAYRSGWDLAWPVTVQRDKLAKVVREISRHIDQPPLAGTVGEGWAMDGVPGLTLNSIDAIALIENALKTGPTAVSLMVRQVPPPQPIELGAPDGALEDEHGALADTALADSAYADPAALRAFQPTDWAPSRGPECDMGGAYSRFCQGPRRVAAPHGPDADRAQALGLGTFKAVSHLIVQPPKAEWTAAAGDSTDATLLYPVKGGTLWRGFGFVRRGDLRDMLHKGVDIGAPRGTPIRAVNDAIVAYADNGVRGYGNLLVMIHGSGSVTSYAHCTAIYVFPGQRVRRGQIVGEVGDTGIARGAHLHFEYRRGGHPVDPQERFVDNDE